MVAELGREAAGTGLRPSSVRKGENQPVAAGNPRCVRYCKRKKQPLTAAQFSLFNKFICVFITHRQLRGAPSPPASHRQLREDPPQPARRRLRGDPPSPSDDNFAEIPIPTRASTISRSPLPTRASTTSRNRLSPPNYDSKRQPKGLLSTPETSATRAPIPRPWQGFHHLKIKLARCVPSSAGDADKLYSRAGYAKRKNR